MQTGAPWLFFFVFILMIGNWTIEAFKWRSMISKIEHVKLSRSLEAVFSGLTISFFTPNRIGEYAGRVFHLQHGKRMQATLITVIENSSQLIVTVVTGCIASILYLNDYMDVNPVFMILYRILLASFAVISVLLYFNLDLFEKFFLRFKLSEYWRQIFHVFALYSSADLLKVLLLSCLRYFVFTLQFIILLKVYGCNFPFLTSMLMIAMTFFVISVVPTFAITEITVRGLVSTYFFGKLTIDTLPVLNAAFSLWLINLVLPAVAGAIFIFHFRFDKNHR